MKLILFICFVTNSFLCLSQTNPIESDSTKKDFIYSEIVGIGKILSNKLNVSIDYGQKSNAWQNDKIVDENGKTITFNSMVDAMNYMGNLGWEFVQAYVVTEPGGLGGSQNVYRWLMKIRAAEDEKGDFIPITKHARKQSLKK